MIGEIIERVLIKGYLDADTEIKIQLMFNGGCTLAELDALIDLQNAILSGHVKRELSPVRKLYPVRQVS